MEFEFDPEKRTLTLRYRQLDMADACEAFSGKNLTFPDVRFDYGEKRFVTVGYLNRRMVVLAWTDRGGRIRITSLRKANAREQKKYAPDLRSDG